MRDGDERRIGTVFPAAAVFITARKREVRKKQENGIENNAVAVDVLMH